MSIPPLAKKLQWLRLARLAWGKFLERFNQEWNKKSPPKAALQWYGFWADAKPLAPVFRP